MSRIRTKKRILFDLTTLALWTGPPTGIVRVQQKLAQYARTHRADVVFTLFDCEHRVWREIESQWVDRVLDRNLSIDMSMVRVDANSRKHFGDRLPPLLSKVYYGVTKSRRRSMYAADMWRMTTTSPWRRKFSERIVQALMKPKDHDRFFDEQGNRRDCARFRSVAGKVIQHRSDDITVAAQSDWSHDTVGLISELKKQIGFRHAVLCYDIIPILFPQWYHADEAASFRDYYDQALPTADCVVVNASCTSRDVRSYCEQLGIDPPPIIHVPLAADKPAPALPGTRLPSGLRPEKYAMFVSTIEPRKNHSTIVQAWRRIVAEGVARKHQFSLVFVGRPGWKMDHFIPEIRSDAQLSESIHFLHGVQDGELARLYQESAFCLYPPIYEGFGLPAVEAIKYGKPLLASTGGSVPEAVGDAAQCLDPLDVNAWYTWMRKWIENPQALAAARPAPEMCARTLEWDESANRFFQVVDRLKAGELARSSQPPISQQRTSERRVVA